MSLTNNYSWGVDGYGRQHICKAGDRVVIACAVGCCAIELIEILERQDEEIQRTTKSNLLPSTKGVE